MSLLLDTHYVYALAGAPARTSQREREFLRDYQDPFVVSAVSIWEIRLKWNALYASGARKGPLGPQEVLDALSESDTVWFLPLTPAHAATTLKLPLAHRDPFDELLLTQAQAEDLKLLSRDRKLFSHPLAQRIPA